MASSKTENYGLNQWVESDEIHMDDFNADNAVIEEALKNFAAEFANCGNCKIATSSYTGTGTYGTGNPTRITFSFVPKLVYIMHVSAPQMRAVYLNGARYMTTEDYGANSATATCTLTNTMLSIVASSASAQMNASGSSYVWVAIG